MMAPDADPNSPPPLGNWNRTYAAVMVLAVLVMFLLWLMTTLGNVPLGSAR